MICNISFIRAGEIKLNLMMALITIIKLADSLISDLTHFRLNKH